MNKEKLIEFLSVNKNYVLDCKLKLRLTSKNKIRISSGRKSIISNDIHTIIDFAEKYSNGFRICNRCGKPCEEIMMDEDGFYSCEECFEDYMDEIYGARNWLQVNDDGNNGYYIFKDNNIWSGTGIFYTDFI
jgi:hypothetical protein